MALEVLPEVVAVIIASAPRSLAITQADLPMAFVMDFSTSLILFSKISSWSIVFSVYSKIFLIVTTASRGYLPLAVSPDSMTALVPSRTALATSFVSARVGLGFLIMESNICVAVITVLPTMLHFFIISFCTIGTASVSISTPKSPLATIIPSETSIISSIKSTALWDSILEIIFVV